MHSMLRHPLAALEQRSSSQWLQLFRDVSAMRSGMSGGLATSLLDLPMALLALVVIGIIAWPVLPVILVAMLIMCALAWWWADEVRSGRVEEIAQARMLDRGRPRSAMPAPRSRCWATTPPHARTGKAAMTAGSPRALARTARWRTHARPAPCC